MSIEISRETEARLVEEARKRGVSVDELLQRLIDEREAATHLAGTGFPELPVWDLGTFGPLHRRDIYRDDG